MGKIKEVAKKFFDYLCEKYPILMIGILGLPPQEKRTVRSVISVDMGKTWTEKNWYEIEQEQIKKEFENQ